MQQAFDNITRQRKYLPPGAQKPFTRKKAIWSIEDDYVRSIQEPSINVSTEYFSTFPVQHGVDLEDACRGMYQYSWSETVAGHSSNEFYSVKYKHIKENHTGATNFTNGMDAAGTNLCRNALKFFHALCDERFGEHRLFTSTMMGMYLTGHSPMVNDMIGSKLESIANLNNDGFPTTTHRVNFLKQYSPTINVIQMQQHEFIDFDKTWDNFPYIKGDLFDEDGKKFQFCQKPVIISFGVSYVWNNVNKQFERVVHPDFMYVWHSVDFKLAPRIIRIVKKNSKTFPKFKAIQLERHRVHVDKIKNITSALEQFQSVKSPYTNEIPKLKKYYNSALTKTDEDPNTNVDATPETFIRRMEIQQAFLAIAAGKTDVIIPPNFKKGNICRGDRAKAHEKNVRIKKAITPTLLCSMSTTELSSLCEKHDLAKSGSKLAKLDRLRAHLVYFHHKKWNYFDYKKIIESQKALSKLSKSRKRKTNTSATTNNKNQKKRKKRRR